MSQSPIVRITGFHMREMLGRENPMRAQFQMELRPESLKGIVAAFDELTEPELITNTDVAKMMGSDFQYGAPVPAGEIPGGWEAERVAFMLTAELTMMAGIVIEVVIGGYTDKLPEKTDAGMSWDDVTFYVNSVTEFRRQVLNTPEGLQVMKHLHAADHVLVDLIPNYHPAPIFNARAVKARPADIFNTMDIAYIRDAGIDADTIDTRTLLTHLPSMSSRDDVIPSVWLAKVMRSFFQAQSTLEIDSTDPRMVTSHARSYALDRSPMTVAFLNVLTRITGMQCMGMFGLKDIKQIDGNFRNQTTYVQNSDRPTGKVLSVKHLPDNLQTHYRNGGEAIERAAMLVANATNALIAKLGIRQLSFHVDNRWAGVEQAVMASVTTYDEIDPANLIDQFRLRFVNEVMPSIDMGGLWECRFRVRADLYDETEVEWELVEEQSFHLYRHASFADALLSPLVIPLTKDRPLHEELHVQLADTVDTILESIVVPK